MKKEEEVMVEQPNEKMEEKEQNREVHIKELAMIPPNLSPCQLVDSTDREFFICHLCDMVPQQPKECQECHRLACSACLSKLLSTQQCSDDCSGLLGNYSKIHRFVQQSLEDSLFKCEHSQCNSNNMKYKQALSHWQQCKYSQFQCKYGCGLMITVDTLDSHKQICKMNYHICEQCYSEIYFLDQDKQHDCLAQLSLKAKNVQYHTNLTQYEVESKCKKGHVLSRQLLNTYGQGYVVCDLCERNEIEHQDFYYQCKPCRYDVCRSCTLLSILPDKELMVQSHVHPLNRVHRNQNQWMCSSTAVQGGCYSGITNREMTKHITGWKCSQGCDFYQCLNCCLVQQKRL